MLFKSFAIRGLSVMLIRETSRVSSRLSDWCDRIFCREYNKVCNRVRLISGMPCKMTRDRIPAIGASAIVINRVYVSVKEL